MINIFDKNLWHNEYVDMATTIESVFWYPLHEHDYELFKIHLLSLLEKWGSPLSQKQRAAKILDVAHFQSFLRNLSRDQHKLMLNIRDKVLIVITTAVNMKSFC